MKSFHKEQFQAILDDAIGRISDSVDLISLIGR